MWHLSRLCRGWSRARSHVEEIRPPNAEIPACRFDSIFVLPAREGRFWEVYCWRNGWGRRHSLQNATSAHVSQVYANEYGGATAQNPESVARNSASPSDAGNSVSLACLSKFCLQSLCTGLPGRFFAKFLWQGHLCCWLVKMRVKDVTLASFWNYFGCWRMGDMGEVSYPPI